jgi:hypothetical protein
MPALDKKTRQKTLKEMRDAYRAGYELSRKTGAGDAYPLGNQIAGDIVLSWSGKVDEQAVAESIDALEQLAASLAATQTDTFNLSAAADRLLLRALLARDLDDDASDPIAKAYTNAMSRGASSKVRKSIRTQFQLFRTLMKTEFPSEGRDTIIEQLKRLEQKLLS